MTDIIMVEDRALRERLSNFLGLKQCMHPKVEWSDVMPICRRIQGLQVEYNGSKSHYFIAMMAMKEGMATVDIEKTFDGIVQFVDWMESIKRKIQVPVDRGRAAHA